MCWQSASPLCLILQARNLDAEEIVEFHDLLEHGIPSLITLCSQGGHFFLWAHGDRSLYLGTVPSFPASIFMHPYIHAMQYHPNAVQVGDVAFCQKSMAQLLQPPEWQRLMGLADEVEFMDETTYDALMGGLWENMGLTVYEVRLRIHIRYKEVP